MRVVALISGGKDSCYNLMQCVGEGHEVVALANLKPKDRDELDSYMFQTVGHHAIDLYADALGLPLYRHTIEGGSIQQGKDYTQDPMDEVEDLYILLKKIQDELHVEGVSVGAILSDYQRVRVENVCSRLGLVPLAYLWRRNQEELLGEMIDCGLQAIMIKVAALGLEPKKHLGKTLSQMYPHMLKMESLYGLNVCGEGGEYETFTLDCPLFNKRIVIDEVEEVLHSDDAFAPVGYLNFKVMHVEEKEIEESVPWTDRLKDLSMKHSCDILTELDIAEDLSPDATEPCKRFNHPPLKGVTPVVKRSKSGFTWIAGLEATKQSDSTIESATKIMMDQLLELLASNGLQKEHLVMCHLYVSSMRDFAKINNVYKTYFSANPPARVCVQCNLPQGVVLQLDCTAYFRELQPLDRRTMHVQSLSHWAPANIGPYSQAGKLGELILVAGQIAMRPSDLSLVMGGASGQARLSLRHVSSILGAVCDDPGLQQVALCICYMTSPSHFVQVKEEWNQVLNQRKTRGHSRYRTVPDILVEWVVVPSLPKGAAVEWQVYASSSEIPVISGQLDRKAQDCSISLKYKLRGKHPRMLSFILSADFLKPSGSITDMPGLATSVISMIKECLKKAQDEDAAIMDDDDDDDDEPAEPFELRSLRLLYKIDLVDPQLLYDEFKSASKEIEDNLPIAFVPVNHFSRELQVFSICC